MTLDNRLDSRLGEIRKHLRTDLDLGEIAELMNVPRQSLERVIRRNSLCDLPARKQLILRKRKIMAVEAGR